MRSVFHVTIAQNISNVPQQDYNPQRETYVVGAVNALIATRKALREAHRNGFLKSIPLEVETVERVVRDFS